MASVARLPTHTEPRRHDEDEKKLGYRFAKGAQPSKQQLSGDVLQFINGISGAPLHDCSVNIASGGTREAVVSVQTVGMTVFKILY